MMKTYSMEIRQGMPTSHGGLQGICEMETEVSRARRRILAGGKKAGKFEKSAIVARGYSFSDIASCRGQSEEGESYS